MAISSRGRIDVPLAKKWNDRETSPERTKVWTEPKLKTERKVPVVYYLCRNGHLEHPHFIEVSLTSNEGLYLRDFISRLNFLRGKGIASLYSWSSKRSYKNGFVWHDLSENDFIYPAHGHEYVLKGSELLEASLSSGSQQAAQSVSSSSGKLLEIPKTEDDSEFPVGRRRNLSWSALDINEYKVYKADPTVEISGKAADASTQTDDKRRRRRAIIEEQEQEAVEEDEDDCVNHTTELNRDEISPPESSPSPETLESLMKAEGRVTNSSIHGEGEISEVVSNGQSGRIRASAVLMQLISCGSISVREQGLSLIPHYRGRLVPRGGRENQVVSKSKEMEGLMDKDGLGGLRLEDKEYFSGSLIETKKKGNECGGEAQGLKRSSSYNADRSSRSDLMAKEINSSAQSKCIPRKPKAPPKKESNTISSSSHGSKRMEDVKT
ncbi:hypothetical protein AAC387_Pa07g3681 [Persea americana]